MGDAIGLGIDVGGTNTDSVLIDLENKKVLSFAKAATTRADLALGISDSLEGLEQRHFPDIVLVGLSTTLATNAIVEGVRRRVLGLLIGYGPDDFPRELGEDVMMVRGGHDVRGEVIRLVQGRFRLHSSQGVEIFAAGRRRRSTEMIPVFPSRRFHRNSS